MNVFSKKIFFIFLVLPAAILFLSSCRLTNLVERLPKTPENITFESFVPENSFFVFSFFPTTPEEALFANQHTQKILQNFEGGIPALLESLPESLSESLSPLFPENNLPPFLVALQNDETRKSRTSFFAVTRSENPESLREKLLALPDAEEKNGKIIVTSQSPERYAMFQSPYLFIASSPELFPGSVPAENSKFLKDKEYRDHLKKAPKSFSGYFFFKFQKEQKKETSSLFPSFLPKEGGAITFFSSEASGFRSTGFVKILKDPDSDPLIAEGLKGSEISLAQKIPAENVILYLEGFNLANQFRLQKKLLLEDPFFAVRQGEQFFQNLEKKAGFSLEKDLFPALSRNFAFVLEDQGKILPAISLWVDASENPEGAKKILTRLDGVVHSLVAVSRFGAIKQGEEKNEEEKKPEPFLEQKTFEWNGNQIKQAVFYPNRLSEQQEKPTPLFALTNETWEFSYGLTKDNLLFISTRGAFPTQSINQLEAYQSLVPEISGFSETEHSFFNPGEIISIVERIVALGKSSEKITAEQEKIFGIIKNAVKPIQGFISANRRRGDFLENKAFLAIE